MKFVILISFCTYLCIRHVVAATSSDTIPRNNYTVTSGNITCVVMTAGFQLVVPYIGETKNYTTTMEVPSNAYSSGSCGPNENVMNIDFNNSWGLSFTFVNTSMTSYQMTTINLHYVMEQTWFPNISSTLENQPNTLTSTHLANGTYQASVDGSFQCQGQATLTLNGSVTINIYDLQYRAFGNTNSTLFSTSNVKSCPQTDPLPETSVTAAVSVGIALAVMIVVVVLLYFTFTKAKGHKYGYT